MKPYVTYLSIAIMVLALVLLIWVEKVNSLSWIISVSLVFVFHAILQKWKRGQADQIVAQYRAVGMMAWMVVFSAIIFLMLQWVFPMNSQLQLVTVGYSICYALDLLSRRKKISGLLAERQRRQNAGAILN